ncbi:hypothetical protein NPIL_69631 [Nephila pilipes]|uniref:Uncharacterized protein n=1 Tax=Nephila pilipes TaxID=299642 RepID=A0A8X6MAL2_NEPPI|nr:hypothetical protein NPIL_69631 [Nephila pilipes]
MVIFRNIVVSVFKKSFERILSVTERNRNRGVLFLKKILHVTPDATLVRFAAWNSEHSCTTKADFHTALLGRFRSDDKKRGLTQYFVGGFRESSSSRGAGSCAVLITGPRHGIEEP